MGESKFEGPQGPEKSPEDERREFDERTERQSQEFRALLRDRGIEIEENLFEMVENQTFESDTYYDYISDDNGVIDRKKFDTVLTLLHLRGEFMLAEEEPRKDRIERLLEQLKNLV